MQPRSIRAHSAGWPSGAIQSGGGGAQEDREYPAILRNPSPEPVQPAQPGCGCRAGSDDSRPGYRARSGRRICPTEIRAAGISILSDKVDIANVRLAFPGGCIANLTASRVSTERVRKLRLFQPHQYISLDYERQQAAAFTVSEGQRIGFENVTVEKQEPLQLEVASFLQCVSTRKRPRVSGEDGLRALDSALDIIDKIEEHTQVVAQRLKSLL